MDRFPRYVSAQLHCHSSIEGPASIGAHCHEARRVGVEVVWLTDHDTRIALCIGGPFFDRFDFEYPDLATTVERAAPGGRTVQRGVGWAVSRRDAGLAASAAALSRERCYTGTQSLCLEAAAGADEAQWQYLVLDFRADAKLHGRPLLAEPTVGLAIYLDAAEGEAEAWLDLALSEQPPDLRQARLRYLIAGAATHEPEDGERYVTRTLRLAAPAGAWARHELHPAEDAAQGLGGADNALGALRLGLRVRRGGRARLFVDDLTLAHRCAGNELHGRQRALARKLGEAHGVVCHVAQEISMAGQHKNAWGLGLPLLDYAARPGGFSHEEGVAWAQRHGALFSLNHPFSRYNRVELDDVAREQALADLVETYVGTGASGANTLEVGFPAGRHGFDLDHYLRLWDGLSRRGVIVTGSGSSDAHSARVGWQTGNNFATYIRSDSTAEEALLAGLRSGNVYMADPALFRSRLHFGDRAGHRMGQVVPCGGPAAPGGSGGPGPAAEVELVLDAARPHWRLCWVVDGARRPPIALGEGPHVETLAVPLGSPTFVRAEIWDATRAPDGRPLEQDAGAGPTPGRCIALTNPIWYVAAAGAARYQATYPDVLRRSHPKVAVADAFKQGATEQVERTASSSAAACQQSPSLVVPA